MDYLKEYLSRLKRRMTTPNFWCSHEYLLRANLEPDWYKDWTIHALGLRDRESGQLMFPYIDQLGFVQNHLPTKGVWADFEDFNPSHGDKEFLDYEYIYNPKDFETMPGKQWATFRKNSRKFPRRWDAPTEYTQIRGLQMRSELMEVVHSWVDALVDENVEDASILVDYAMNGENRKVLISKQTGVVLGLNVWDYSYMYTNFRYCICRDEPFLSEYMRWLFYTDPYVPLNRLVNDGGTLGRDSLKIFKDKLNPVEVRSRYSWKPKRRQR